MSNLLWFVLLALLVAGLGWSLRPVRTAGPTTPSQAWLAAEAHARRITAAAWTALVPLPMLLAAAMSGPVLSGPSRGAFVAALPAIAGTAYLTVHAGGELTWPRPAGAVRRAALARRRIRDVAPRALTWVSVSWFAALALLLAVCGLAAGTGGRSLTYAHADMVSTASPFPGLYYGRTIAPAIAVLALGCVGTLLLVARRPAVSDTSPADDVALRRTSASRILAGVQLVTAWTLAGCLFFAANAVATVQPAWADVVVPGSSQAVGTVARFVSLAVVIASVVIAVRATRAASAPVPAGAVEPAGPAEKAQVSA
ncbi:hypothetical protein [Cellulomonas fengjieae]|uniref:hypothetical protein n=1 Tax=Cellulomonas fengjieae TaxID=2819978 RepID=UPI001AAE31BF|nr:hypothetical protein [Cellulomonas fengjieae]MBO3101723.1 hypothetical protein [Cellulomonas fengjieae]